MSEDENMVRQNTQSFISAARKHKKLMSKSLDTTGVYQGQHRILMCLAEHSCESQKQIANVLGISTASLAVSIKKLKNGGYLEKEMNKEDNRINKISITEKGRRVVEQSYRIFMEVDASAFVGFSREEMETLAAMLQRINENLDSGLSKVAE